MRPEWACCEAPVPGGGPEAVHRLGGWSSGHQRSGNSEEEVAGWVAGAGTPLGWAQPNSTCLLSFPCQPHSTDKTKVGRATWQLKVCLW